MIIKRQTLVPASQEEVWRVVSDPARLPQWWPSVSRVEDASTAAWTTVLSSPKGKSIRADYTRLELDPERRLVWRQELEETPFERILAHAVTEIALSADEAGTKVTIALDQKPRGWARFAPLQFRGAGVRQVQGALDGLKAVFAP